MLRKNQLIPLTITGLTHEGSGIGRFDGMAVFVPMSAPGDELTVRVVKALKNSAFGIIERVDSPSPRRVPNDCPVFSRCGGCSLRHIDYAAELEAKRDWVRQNMARIGGITLEPEPIVASPKSIRYRNKAQYPVRLVGGRARTGFFAPRSHTLIPVEDCLLQPSFFAQICKTVCSFMDENSIPPYDEASHSGVVRHIYIRHAEATGQTLVCLVLNADDIPLAETLSERLAAVCPGPLSLCLNKNTGRTNVILGPETRAVSGPGRIEDEICGVRISLSPESFYQVNRGAAELLYRTALDYAGINPGELLLDMYCGAGAIGLSMASSAGQVVGVETVARAVEDARANARLNNIRNARFICADAAQAAGELSETGSRPHVVVVDPPRKGVDAAALGHIAAMNPRRIVYISCNSATLARDCKLLAGYGYAVGRVGPVDLFPRTAHVECVALLSRSE